MASGTQRGLSALSHAYWSNVPAKVWDNKLGGYQVIKKWLGYRERDVLGCRRIAAILLLGPARDANYEAVRAAL